LFVWQKYPEKPKFPKKFARLNKNVYLAKKFLNLLLRKYIQ